MCLLAKINNQPGAAQQSFFSAVGMHSKGRLETTMMIILWMKVEEGETGGYSALLR